MKESKDDKTDSKLWTYICPKCRRKVYISDYKDIVIKCTKCDKEFVIEWETIQQYNEYLDWYLNKIKDSEERKKKRVIFMHLEPFLHKNHY